VEEIPSNISIPSGCNTFAVLREVAVSLRDDRNDRNASAFINITLLVVRQSFPLSLARCGVLSAAKITLPEIARMEPIRPRFSQILGTRYSR